jgi:hypothetical protein
MVSGGYRPTAEQNNPMSVSATGGNGQSGNRAREAAVKAQQLRPSGGGEYRATQALTSQIQEGGNVKTTATAANPQPRMSADVMNQFMSEIVPIDAEPTEYLPISDGVDFGAGRGSEVISPRLTSSINQTEGIDIIKRYLPDLLNATRLPGAPDSYKRFVNFLRAQIL